MVLRDCVMTMVVLLCVCWLSVSVSHGYIAGVVGVYITGIYVCVASEGMYVIDRER